MKKKIKTIFAGATLLFLLTGCSFGNTDNSVDKNEVIITWLDYDGKVIAKDIVNKGDTPNQRGKDIETISDSKTDKIFDGWLPSVDKVYENTTYQAQYILKDYFVDEEEMLASISDASLANYSTSSTLNDVTTINDLDGNKFKQTRKDSTGDTISISYFDNEYKYYLYDNLWFKDSSDSDIVNSTKTKVKNLVNNFAFKGSYNETKRCFVYEDSQSSAEVYFLNGKIDKFYHYDSLGNKDDELLFYNYGTNKINLPLAKEYVSIKWSINGEIVLENNLKPGMIPVYNGVKPIKDVNPDNYDFVGWSPSIVAAYEDATYEAVFEEITFEVTEEVFKNAFNLDDFTNFSYKDGNNTFRFDGDNWHHTVREEELYGKAGIQYKFLSNDIGFVRKNRKNGDKKRPLIELKDITSFDFSLFTYESANKTYHAKIDDFDYYIGFKNNRVSTIKKLNNVDIIYSFAFFDYKTTFVELPTNISPDVKIYCYVDEYGESICESVYTNESSLEDPNFYASEIPNSHKENVSKTFVGFAPEFTFGEDEMIYKPLFLEGSSVVTKNEFTRAISEVAFDNVTLSNLYGTKIIKIDGDIQYKKEIDFHNACAIDGYVLKDTLYSHRVMDIYEMQKNVNVGVKYTFDYYLSKLLGTYENMEYHDNDNSYYYKLDNNEYYLYFIDGKLVHLSVHDYYVGDFLDFFFRDYSSTVINLPWQDTNYYKVARSGKFDNNDVFFVPEGFYLGLLFNDNYIDREFKAFDNYIESTYHDTYFTCVPYETKQYSINEEQFNAYKTADKFKNVAALNLESRSDYNLFIFDNEKTFASNYSNKNNIPDKFVFQNADEKIAYENYTDYTVGGIDLSLRYDNFYSEFLAKFFSINFSDYTFVDQETYAYEGDTFSYRLKFINGNLVNCRYIEYSDSSKSDRTNDVRISFTNYGNCSVVMPDLG